MTSPPYAKDMAFMKTKFLTLALLSGMACTSYAHQAPIIPLQDGAAHFLRLKDLPEVMAISQREPDRWRTPDDLRGLTYEQAAASGNPVVAWISGESLASPDARALAHAAIRHGLPVLVTSRPGIKRYETDVFGAEGQGHTSLYRRGKDGVMEISTLDDTAADSETAQSLYRQLSKRATSSHFARLTLDTKAAPASSDIPEGVPHERFRYRPITVNGNKVVHDIVVLHDTRPDSKVVIVKAGIDIMPTDNGVYDRTSSTAIRRDGIGDYLAVAGRYELKTVVGWEGQDKGPDLRLERMIPDSSPDVDRNVERSSGVSTSYGINVGSTEDALKNLGILPIGKVELSGSRTYTDSTSVSMATKSYYTEASSENYGRDQSANWNFYLANDIAADPTYFNTDGRKVSTKMVTPMMRRASTELVSVWRVEGDYDGKLKIGSSGRVENKRYGWTQSLGASWDRSSDIHPSYTADLPWWFWSSGKDPWADLRAVPAQPSQVVSINLDSPFLTATPTVLIQSRSGEGLCLAQKSSDTKGGELTMQECDATPSNLAQQWNLDAEGRYKNRQSKQCLQVATGTGIVSTAPCALRTQQRWKWYADRIVSATDGGTVHRLEITKGKPVAKFDANRHDRIVRNGENDLLPPWSDYPFAPTEGSTIPRFNGNWPTVSASYLKYRDVSAEERWETIPLER